MALLNNGLILFGRWPSLFSSSPSEPYSFNCEIMGDIVSSSIPSSGKPEIMAR
jgi:hypothetical protein